MPEITSHYTFRGLLATLQPEVFFHHVADPVRWFLMCFIWVPHRTSGKLFSTYMQHEWKEEPDQLAIDTKTRELFKALMMHEVDESLGVEGVYEDVHGAPEGLPGSASAGSTPARPTTAAPPDAVPEP